MAMRDVILVSAVGFVLFFVFIWSFALWAIAWTCGWRRLAKRYGDVSLFHGETVPFASAQIGLANYTGALHVGATDLGLHLAPMRVFRPFHRPLFIPWTEIETNAREAELRRTVRLTFPSAPRASMTLYGRSVPPVRPYLSRCRAA